MAIRNTPPLSEAVAAYLEMRETNADLAPRSFDSESKAMARFVRYTLKQHAGRDLQVGRLTSKDVQAFLNALRKGDPTAGCEKALGHAAMRLFTSRLKMFAHFCHDEGWHSAVIMPREHKNLLRKGPRRNWLVLTPQELADTMNEAAPRDRAIIACAMNTGLRTNEMQRMRYADLDFTHGRIFTTITKSRKTVQTRITADLEIELRRWIAWYRDAIGGDIPQDAYLFPAMSRPHFSGHGTPQRQTIEPYKQINHPERIAQRALTRLGYADRLEREGMHTFRRSAARMMFDMLCERGGYSNALEKVSKWLNHASMQTTEGYLNISSPEAELDDMLIGKPFLSSILNAATEATPDNVRQLRAVE